MLGAIPAMPMPLQLQALHHQQVHGSTAEACMMCIMSGSVVKQSQYMPASCLLQTLSVAVHNHYKRVRHETTRRRLKEQQAATAAAHGTVPAFVQSGKVTRSILETTTGPGITPQSPLTGPHSQPHDRFPFPPTADAGIRAKLLLKTAILSTAPNPSLVNCDRPCILAI